MSTTSPSNPHSQTRPLDQQDKIDADHGQGLIGDQRAGSEGSKEKDGGVEAENNPEMGRKGNSVGSGHVCVIDVRQERDTERERSLRRENSSNKVCRICQLGSDHLPAGAGSKMVHLVDLGCACKGDLGVSHYYCARAWFLQKGNRTCEICGKPAKNIKGIGDTGIRGFRAMNSTSHVEGETEERENQCSKSLCNFILAAIILAFFLPWFFHPAKLL